jgi:hypothetical protein
MSLKQLNRIATEALRFGTLYQTLCDRTHFGTERHSFLHSISSRTPTVPPRITGPVRFSPARPIPSLDSLAHQATRSDFEIYPEFRLPASSFGPRRSNDFLVRRRQATSPSTMSELAELNRLARLVELTSKTTPFVPIYGFAPTLSSSLANNKLSQQCVAGILSFTDAKNPSVQNDFAKCFPKTTKPHVTFFSGQPRIARDVFNGLLASKLAELRSRLGTTSTPAGAPALVASWINSLLSKKTTPRSPRATRSSRPEQSRRNTQEPVFVPSTQPEVLPPSLVAIEPSTPELILNSFDDCVPHLVTFRDFVFDPVSFNVSSSELVHPNKILDSEDLLRCINLANRPLKRCLFCLSINALPDPEDVQSLLQLVATVLLSNNVKFLNVYHPATSTLRTSIIIQKSPAYPKTGITCFNLQNELSAILLGYRSSILAF